MIEFEGTLNKESSRGNFRMEKSPREMIQILPKNQVDVVGRFIDLGEELNCIFQVRFAKAHRSWKCVVKRTRPSKVLYTIECKDDKWHIKACLWNIDVYRDGLDRCSASIRNIITSAYDCKLCNTHCNGGARFTHHGQQYRKCIGCCFYFTGLSEKEWDELVCLIRSEFIATSKN